MVALGVIFSIKLDTVLTVVAEIVVVISLEAVVAEIIITEYQS